MLDKDPSVLHWTFRCENGSRYENPMNGHKLWRCARCPFPTPAIWTTGASASRHLKRTHGIIREMFEPLPETASNTGDTDEAASCIPATGNEAAEAGDAITPTGPIKTARIIEMNAGSPVNDVHPVDKTTASKNSKRDREGGSKFSTRKRTAATVDWMHPDVYKALFDDNQELRGELQALQDVVKDTQSVNEALRNLNDALWHENEILRSQLDKIKSAFSNCQDVLFGN